MNCNNLVKLYRAFMIRAKKEVNFIASRKCLDKLQASETYLKENPVKDRVQ
ncbi:hypothetical protein DPMN_066744 [Dreissena polymorpha]|uniref:Uncharacterized protein n=1 Tax=Dreissena polymorpha TaxID=45954 RepID=A0A9D4BT45_DREPO|nr:hypothetical protein DPMN_066744 [Dreissena polymorpha]